MWFADEPEMAWVFETSGRQIQAGYSGQWVAACSPAEQKKILEENPKIKDEWDKDVQISSEQIYTELNKTYNTQIKNIIKKQLDYKFLLLYYLKYMDKHPY